VTSAGRSTSTDQARLHEVVDSVVSGAGYDLEELTVVAAGRRRMLRVVIDSDAGVDLDDAATVSRDISAELDAFGDSSDPMGAAAYTLEVTSPGIGRPLTLPRHFRRARGRLLSITRTDGSVLIGRVVRAGDSTVDLLVGTSGLDPYSLDYAAIARAKVEVEFSAPSARVLALLGAETSQKFQQDGPVDMDDEDPAEPDAEPEAFEIEDDEDHEDDER
jgi:ribosome maturation factor RimP